MLYILREICNKIVSVQRRAGSAAMMARNITSSANIAGIERDFLYLFSANRSIWTGLVANGVSLQCYLFVEFLDFNLSRSHVHWFDYEGFNRTPNFMDRKDSRAIWFYLAE